MLASAVGVATQVERPAGVDDPAAHGSPASRVDRRGSPVSAVSSSTAGAPRTTPSTGTTSPGRTSEPVAGLDLADGHGLQPVAAVALDLLRRPAEQGGELAVGTALGVLLERLARGQHHRDHGGGEQLPERPARHRSPAPR